MTELKVTKEKVLAYVSNHPEHKKILEEWFPEAFEEEDIKSWRVDNNPQELIFIGESYAPRGLDGKCLMYEREKFTITDFEGYTVLVPKRKK